MPSTTPQAHNPSRRPNFSSLKRASITSLESSSSESPTNSRQQPIKDCDFYIQHGFCGFGEQCRFAHPPHKANRVLAYTIQGLPIRQGVLDCKHYIKYGTCLFGFTCKFNHPAPVEHYADFPQMVQAYDLYQMTPMGPMAPMFLLPAPQSAPPFVPVYPPPMPAWPEEPEEQ